MKRNNIILIASMLAAIMLVLVGCTGKNESSGVNLEGEVKLAQIGGNSSIINVNFASLDYADYAARLDIRLDQQVDLVERDIAITPDDAAEIDMIQRPDVGRVSVFLIVKKEEVITVTIKKEGYTFNPASRTVDLSPPIEEEWD